MEVSGKRVPFKCVNDGTSKGLFASAQGGVCINVEEGKIVRYSSMSLSSTLIIPLYELALVSFL